MRVLTTDTCPCRSDSTGWAILQGDGEAQKVWCSEVVGLLIEIKNCWFCQISQYIMWAHFPLSCLYFFWPGLRCLSRYSNGSHHNPISLSHTISSTFDSRPSWKYWKVSFFLSYFNFCYTEREKVWIFWGVNKEENKTAHFRNHWHVWSELGLPFDRELYLPDSFLLLLPY